MGQQKLVSNISIHAPRVGSDYSPHPLTYQELVFQSTLPVWGATPEYSLLSHQGEFQSTLPVWGATEYAAYLQRIGKFQSTLPVWGATYEKSN